MSKNIKRFIANIFVGVFCILSVFFASSCTAKTDIQVYAPDGAPALALAKLLQEDSKDDGVSFTVVSASTIHSYVTGETPQADVCILPLNLASKLLGNGQTYSFCGVVTHGNLYMLSMQETLYTAQNLSLLIGKTVGVVQLANVPGLTFKIILNKLGLPWSPLQNDETPKSDVVNLKAITPDMVSPATKGVDVFVAPEPAASVKVEKTPLEFVGNLQALYDSENGYPQAVLVVKKSLIEGNRVWVQSFLNDVKENALWLQTQTNESEIFALCQAVQSHLTQGLTPSFTKENLSQSSIKNSGIRFQDALLYKGQISAFIQQMLQVQDGSAAYLQDEFYYGN